MTISEAATTKLILSLVDVQIIISCVESLYKADIYKPYHLLDWYSIRKFGPIFKHKRTRGFFDIIFPYPQVIFFISLRLALALSLIYFLYFAHLPLALLSCIILITIIGVLLTWRNIGSNNGADQMSNIILIAISISSIGPPGSLIRIFSLSFIASQSELSYLTSGFLTLLEKDWRNGDSLRNILSTGTFGNRALKHFLDTYSKSYKIGSVAVIGGEILLGCAILVSPTGCLILLGLGLLFHLFVAFVMGLNTFFWTFSATYPAIYYLSLILHK